MRHTLLWLWFYSCSAMQTLLLLIVTTWRSHMFESFVYLCASAGTRLFPGTVGVPQYGGGMLEQYDRLVGGCRHIHSRYDCDSPLASSDFDRLIGIPPYSDFPTGGRQLLSRPMSLLNSPVSLVSSSRLCVTNYSCSRTGIQQ